MSLQSLINKPDKLLEYINSCLKPKNIEKKEFGEVFTPMSVINEMLDKLPLEVWSNPKLTWFDPASGMGNFPIAVYLRLMNGLEKEIIDEKKRKKHILENMLFMSELNKKNVYICKQIFDIKGKYKLNIHQGDSLKLDCKKTFNKKTFDIIIGNPPYNKGGIKSCKTDDTRKKTETIWPKFIIKSFEWLKKDGYLVFINPLSWLRKSHPIHQQMLEKYIIWMKLWDTAKSIEIIHGEIPISLYVLKNTLNTNKDKTEIISEIKRQKIITKSFVYLNPEYSIPLAFHSIFEKLIHFINKNKCSLEVTRKFVKSDGKQIKLPLQYSLQDLWMVDTYTVKDGIMVKRGLKEHPDGHLRKIIISNKTTYKGSFIDEGKLGLTGNDKVYILGDNLELLLKLLSFKISNIICSYTKYRQNFLDNESYTFIPDLRKIGIKDITENDFYKLIDLTKEEIKSIGFKQDDDIKIPKGRIVKIKK